MTIDDAALQRLARTIHESYLAEQRARGVAMGATPAMTAWDTLDDDLKEANRAQARGIVATLDHAGCVMRPGPDPAAFTFDPEELERLARREHRRWAQQRRSAGWSYGAVRDNARKHHPDLVPWSRLSEEVRDKDRDVLRRLPAVLATAGLHIERR